MTATPTDWRPQVKQGDVLRISATYDSKLASWYEVMGIMVVWEQWDSDRGTDPFAKPLDEAGHVTHGHLPENAYYLIAAFKYIKPGTYTFYCRIHPWMRGVFRGLG